MLMNRVWTVLVVVASLLVTVRDVAADDTLDPARHVRASTRELQALLRETAAASPTFKALVDRLEISDLIVYIDARRLARIARGRLRWITATDGARYLQIDIAWPLWPADQATALGHELAHAVEVANAPAIRNVDTLLLFYRSVGRREDVCVGLAFETATAKATEEHIRQELRYTSAARD